MIGAIGKDPDGAYPAHLHLEIRSDLTVGPTYWPSDHGRDVDWIRKHYLDPSAFIRAHRKLPDPAAEPRSCWSTRRATACRSGWAGA